MSLVSLPFNSTTASFLNDNFADLSHIELVNYFYCRDIVKYPRLPQPAPDQLHIADNILRNRFTYTGETFQFDTNFSWQPNPSADKEWQIAFHKHYCLIDLAQAFRQTKNVIYLKKWQTLIHSWIEEMGSGFITLSDAQVEAKRMESWCISFMLLNGSNWQETIDGEFLLRFFQRISEETFYISQNLKRVRNHRTFQLYSIFLVGVLFPELKQHEFFINTGKTLLTENLLTDFQSDGVHIEMSTHYHQLVAETGIRMMELAQLNGIGLSNELKQRIHQAIRFSLYMQWPNGDIPLINDSDNGNHFDLLSLGAQYCQDEELLWGASLGREGKPPHMASVAFPEAGYFILGNTWGEDPNTYANRQHIFYDCGKLGEGSHSHYDLFNFCFFVNGKPALIDPGRYTYSGEPDADGILWRHYFKGTAAHNTVLIDGLDQTRYLNRTKHGPEVSLTHRQFFLGKHGDWIVGRAHSENYTPVHERVFIYMGHEYIFILDNLTSSDNNKHTYELNFHLPDGVETTLNKKGECHFLTSDRCTIYTLGLSSSNADIKPGWVSKYYGIKQAAPIFNIRQTCSGHSNFASVVCPPESLSFRIEDFGNKTIVGEGQCFTVHINKDDHLFQDVFVYTGTTNGSFQAVNIDFTGNFLAYRENDTGEIIFLYAQGVTQLSINGRLIHNSQQASNVEWQP